MIGERGRDLERGSPCQRQREGGDHRVPGTGDIEDMPGQGRERQRRNATAKERHALLTSGDEQRLRRESIEKELAGPSQILERFDPTPERNCGFELVRSECGHTLVVKEVRLFGDRRKRVRPAWPPPVGSPRAETRSRLPSRSLRSRKPRRSRVRPGWYPGYVASSSERRSPRSSRSIRRICWLRAKNSRLTGRTPAVRPNEVARPEIPPASSNRASS